MAKRALAEDIRASWVNQLDEEDKSTVFKIIDTMLTKKKFQDFFQKKPTATK